MTRTLFITATGTGVGKTWVTRGLAAALRARGRAVVAVKPYETGCDPDPRDALAIASAAGEADPARIAMDPGLYRARSPLAPYAATLGGEPPPPPIEALAARTRGLGRGADVLLVEGAGGLLVPVDETHDLADFARALDAPLLLVAKDGLGVLSHVLTACAAARERGLELAAIVLTEHDAVGDPSRAHNARILEERTGAPVVHISRSADDDDALRRVAEELARLVAARPADVTRTRRSP